MQILIHITTCNGEQSFNVLQYAPKPLFEYNGLKSVTYETEIIDFQY